jgi:hypothetical protein
LTEPKEPQARQRAAALLLVPLPCELGTAQQVSRDACIPHAVVLTILGTASRPAGRDDTGMMRGRPQSLAALGPLGLTDIAITIGCSQLWSMERTIPLVSGEPGSTARRADHRILWPAPSK